MIRFTLALSLGAASVAAAAGPLSSSAVTTRTVEWQAGSAACAASHSSRLDARGKIVLADERDQLARSIRDHFDRVPTVLVGANPARGGGLDVQYLLDPAVAGDAAFVAALEQAADIWEAAINDDVTIRVQVGFVSSQSYIAAASSESIFVSYDAFRGAAIADAGPEEAAYLSALPDPLTLIAGFGSTGSSDNGDFAGIDVTTAAARALGFSTGSAPDASIVFNTDFDFDTNPADGVPDDAIDTVYVMVHEIGHMLGFISRADSLFGGGDVATAMDVFRVGSGGASNDPESLAEWTLARRELQAGVEAAFDPVDSIDGAPAGAEWRFSTGAFFGDGRQASHWKDDTLLNIQPAIGVMDPTYEGVTGPGSGGVPGYLTIADKAAFSAIGWDIQLAQAPACPADLSGDGTVGADDLAALLASWGSGGDADLDGSGATDAADLAALVAAWGPCP